MRNQGLKRLFQPKKLSKNIFFVISIVGRELSCLLVLLLDSSQAQNDTKIHSLSSKKKFIGPDSHLYFISSIHF